MTQISRSRLVGIQINPNFEAPMTCNDMAVDLAAHVNERPGLASLYFDECRDRPNKPTSTIDAMRVHINGDSASQERSRSDSSATDTVPVNWEPSVVPVLSQIALHRSDDLGSNNDCVLATEDIAPGTRVLAEKPLMSITNADDPATILSQFYNLSLTQQQKVLALKPVATRPNRDIAHKIDVLLPYYKDLLVKPRNDWTSTQELLARILGAKLGHATLAWRVAARFRGNCFSITTVSQDLRHDLPSSEPVSALFEKASYIRHSCIPNCEAHWSPTINRLVVHAIKPLAKGEELSVSCLEDHQWYEGAELRRQRIAESAVLRCKCAACYFLHEDFLTHENLRKQVREKRLLIDRFKCALMEYESQTLDPDGFPKTKQCHEQQSIPPTYADLLEAENDTLILLDLLKQAGCADSELIRWRIFIVDKVFARMQDESEKAVASLAHASIAEALVKRNFGRDHPMCKDARDRVVRAQGWVKACEDEFRGKREPKNEDVDTGRDRDQAVITIQPMD